MLIYYPLRRSAEAGVGTERDILPDSAAPEGGTRDS